MPNSIWFDRHLFQADEVTALTGSHPVTEVTKVGDNGPESPVITRALFISGLNDRAILRRVTASAGMS